MTSTQRLWSGMVLFYCKQNRTTQCAPVMHLLTRRRNRKEKERWLYYSITTTVTTVNPSGNSHAYNRTMSANIDLRVYIGNNVLLPGSQVPCPATVLVSTKTGKIIDVREGRHVRADYADYTDLTSDDDRWIDVGDKYLLPGLVEYVGLMTCTLLSQRTCLVCLQCACAPQRTWADGLGGLLDGHSCGCVRGNHHRRGHATQLDPADDHGGEPCRQT